MPNDAGTLEYRIPEAQQISMRVFWPIFSCATCAYTGLALLSLGNGGMPALIISAAAGLWLIACILAFIENRWRYLFAGLAVAAIGLPTGVAICFYIHHWLTIGMEAADGMGSPMAFLIGLAFQILLFAPAALLALILAVQKPWRTYP